MLLSFEVDIDRIIIIMLGTFSFLGFCSSISELQEVRMAFSAGNDGWYDNLLLVNLYRRSG